MRSDEMNVRAALRAIREATPRAVTALFQTPVQDTYGFILTDVILGDASMLGNTDPKVLEALKDEVEQYIKDLAWDGAMLEGRGGLAAVSVPEAAWFQAQDATRSFRLARIPTAPGVLPQLTNTDGSLRPAWGQLGLDDLVAQDWNGDGAFRNDVGAEATRHDNTRRAGFALVALLCYRDITDSHDMHAMVGLLKDLRHLCDALGEDFDAQCQQAESAHASEAMGLL